MEFNGTSWFERVMQAGACLAAVGAAVGIGVTVWAVVKLVSWLTA